MTDRTARQLTIASLLTETASVIHTNDLRDRPGRTPAQNSALPPAVTLYGAFNIVICGDPDDTRGDRDGVNSADLVRTFNAYLNQGSALEWSQTPERTHAEIMNALHACASALRDAADRGNLSTLLVGDPGIDPAIVRAIAESVRRDTPGDDPATRIESALIASGVAGPVLGERFDAYSAAIGAEYERMSAEDPTDAEEIETGPGFPVACASVHEHDPIACAPELPADNVGTPGAIWSVTAESFDGTDTPMPAETFVVISDMDALIKAHRAAGASVEVSWPFGSDGTETPTYVHVYVDGRGVVTFRRANPGEISAGEDFEISFTAETEPAGETPNTMRYRVGVLPMSTGTVYGVRDVARDVVLSDVFGDGYGTWSGTREAAEAVVSTMNAEWMTAGGWGEDIYADPDSTLTVDAHNGPERWDGRRWNRYVTDAKASGNMINVRILSID
jgi:hypothetical protein